MPKEAWYQGTKTIGHRVKESTAKEWKKLIDKTDGTSIDDKIQSIIKLCEREGGRAPSETVESMQPALSPSPQDNTCIFLSPWVNEPDTVICMKAFNKKDKVIKLPREACNDCYRKGFVVPSAPSIQKQEQEQKPYKLIKKPASSKVPQFSDRIPETDCPQLKKLVKTTRCEFCKLRTYSDWLTCQEFKHKNPDPQKRKELYGITGELEPYEEQQKPSRLDQKPTGYDPATKRSTNPTDNLSPKPTKRRR